MSAEFSGNHLDGTITIKGVEFAFAELKKTRYLRFLSSAGITLKDSEKEVASYDILQADELLRKQGYMSNDGYYQFTQVKGVLLTGKEKTYFNHEIDISPITFSPNGLIFHLVDLVSNPIWEKGAVNLIRKGYQKGIIFENSESRPFPTMMYPLGKDDIVLPKFEIKIRRPRFSSTR